MAGGKKESKSCDTETSTVAKPALIGITCSRSNDLAKWYHEVLTKAELLEYYDVAGCYILRPNIFAVWEFIQQFIDAKFKEHGIKNCYFPMFVTKGKLTTEENHLEGFSAEVAWVTKSGSSDLAEPIAIRPTSETIMYPAFSKWIRSHRDLPLKLNQWCPVVRWEFSHPTPFIRTREFLWQEGHTAHSTAEEADSFALKMLEVYRAVYEELLAIPVAKGRKSELEKFAGGEVTYTVEGFVKVNGRSIQAATSHYLGTNFSKIFDVKYERVSGEFSHVHQTSFGLSTRSIGALILIHGDDKGLRLPSRVAPTQVIIVPIGKKNVDLQPILARCRSAEARLRAVGVRAEIDDRSLFSPGYKFNHWEMRGVPLRVEIGPRDVEQETVRLVRRVDGAKIDDAFANLEKQVQRLLQLNDELLFAAASAARRDALVEVRKFDEVKQVLAERKQLIAPWCGTQECEKHVKAETGRIATAEALELSGAMKALYTPLQQPDLTTGTQCFACERLAIQHTVWGRSY